MELGKMSSLPIPLTLLLKEASRGEGNGRRLVKVHFAAPELAEKLATKGG
jgi:hypothetical protein